MQAQELQKSAVAVGDVALQIEEYNADRGVGEQPRYAPQYGPAGAVIEDRHERLAQHQGPGVGFSVGAGFFRLDKIGGKALASPGAQHDPPVHAAGVGFHVNSIGA